MKFLKNILSILSKSTHLRKLAKDVACFILLLTIGTACAQSPITYVEEDQNVMAGQTPIESIIRNWNNQYVLSYHKYTSNGFYLCLTDISPLLSGYMPGLSLGMDYNLVSIPNVDIHDIQFVDDYAFFCGESTASGETIIGYADLTDYTTTGSIDIAATIVSDAVSLLKLVAYHDSWSYHIVAIGNDGLTDLIVEMADAINNINITDTYDWTLLTNTGTEIEYADDVHCVGGEVVVVGHIENTSIPSNDLCIRKSGYTDNLIASGTMDDLWVYETNTWEVIIKTLSKPIDYPFLRVAYVAEGDGSVLRTRTIDITNMYNVSSEEFKHDDKWDPIAMVYLYGNQSVRILMDYDGMRSLVEESALPLSGGYTVEARYSNWADFASIDRMYGQWVMMVDGTFWYFQDMIGVMSLPINRCSNTNTVLWLSTPDVLPIQNTYPITLNQNFTRGYSFNLSFTYDMIQPQCEE